MLIDSCENCGKDTEHKVVHEDNLVFLVCQKCGHRQDHEDTPEPPAFGM